MDVSGERGWRTGRGRWMVALVAAGAVLGACTPAGAGGVPDAPGGASLERFLSSRGYTKVPLIRLATGHFSVGGTAGEVSLDMILDTGASHTVLDVERARRFGVTTEDQGGQATGVGLATQSVETGRLNNVEIGPVRFGTLQVSVLDLSEVNRILVGMGNTPVDGIIGADVLMAREAVIDYGSLTVYLKE